MKKALVTGGLGFIGSHLVDRCWKTTGSVVVLDNLLTGRRSNLAQHKGNPRLKVVEGDVRDLGDRLEVLAGMRRGLPSRRPRADAGQPSRPPGRPRAQHRRDPQRPREHGREQRPGLRLRVDVRPLRGGGGRAHPRDLLGHPDVALRSRQARGRGVRLGVRGVQPHQGLGVQVRHGPRGEVPEGGDLGLHPQASRGPLQARDTRRRKTEQGLHVRRRTASTG